MAHHIRGHLIATSATRMRLIPGRLHDRILSHLERLKSIEQRRQTASFGGRRQHDDDIFSIHPRTTVLASLTYQCSRGVNGKMR